MPVCGPSTDWRFFSTCVIVEGFSACYPESMAEQQKIILYGDTLILAGVQASLSLSPNVEIFVLSGTPADLAESLSELHPSAVIFDLEAHPTDFPPSLLQQPGLVLIGINTETHQAVLWAGQQIQELSVPDLIGIIQQKMSCFSKGE